VCFPHLGAGATAYSEFALDLGDTFRSWSIQAPGREDRSSEPLPTSFDELVGRCVEAINGEIGDRAVLFGHSFGALVAWSVARSLARPPMQLIVSGSQGPMDTRTSPLPQGDDASLIMWLEKVAGGPTPVTSDPRIRELFLPTIRHDLRLAQSIRPGTEPLRGVPIHVITAESDPVATPASMSGWYRATTGEVSFSSIPGGHFAVLKRGTLVRDVVLRNVFL